MMTNGLLFVVVIFCCIVLYPTIQHLVMNVVDAITFKQLKAGDLYVHKHNKNDHQYNMYDQHVIVIGKEDLTPNVRKVKFRNLNTNTYQILEWHIFRYYYKHTN